MILVDAERKPIQYSVAWSLTCSDNSVGHLEQLCL